MTPDAKHSGNQQKLCFEILFFVFSHVVHRDTSFCVALLIIKWYKEESSYKKMKQDIQMEMRNIILICEGQH